MDNCANASSKTFCKLCLDNITDGNGKIIEEIIKGVLNVLQPKLIQSEQDNRTSVICDACSTKLLAAYNFKARCMDIEDCISAYVNSENKGPVDLREIYLKEKGNEHLKVPLEDEMICRLCMQVVNYEFISVKDMNIDTLCIYIPEVNFNSTLDPVICAVCRDSLDIHMAFLKDCLNVYEEVKNVSDSKIPDSLYDIVKEEIELKSEDGDIGPSSLKDELLAVTDTNERSSESERTTSNSMPYHENKLSENETSKLKQMDSLDAQIYECDFCDFKTEKKYTFTRHQRKHNPEDQLHCNSCEFKTFYKSDLRLHQLRHKNIPEDQMFKCDVCDYKSIFKEYLKRHQLRHKEIPEDRSYKCDTCEFKTDNKYYFKYHQRRHNPEDQAYKCDTCEFKTAYKSQFKAHLRRHKDIPEDQMFKCDLCDYKSIFKECLKRHQLKHKEIPENQSYKCETCEYKTDIKCYFKYHQRRHNPEDQTYKCDTCEFKTAYKSQFEAHLRRHKDIPEDQMFKCDACDYKAIFKQYLKRHQLKHKKFTEEQIYKCESCDYKSGNKWYLKKHQRRHNSKN